ncbi:hypothetical protein RCH07_003742 [Arthrobacter sp. CG_A4]|nr:hypothetical protein [Arthrobacter sp. CG_A4]
MGGDFLGRAEVQGKDHDVAFRDVTEAPGGGAAAQFGRERGGVLRGPVQDLDRAPCGDGPRSDGPGHVTAADDGDVCHGASFRDNHGLAEA